MTLNGWHNDQVEEGLYVGVTPTDDEIPAYWPQPRKTDANGEFTLETVPKGTYASLTFWHPDYAVDEVTVNTTESESLTPGLRAFEIKPVKPTFTHTLEPARPVQGRVTDEETGKPLAGLLVQMTPMRRHGGMPFHARTDADGRYRISGHGGAFIYFTAVFPPADSGYLAASASDSNWPAGASSWKRTSPSRKDELCAGTSLTATTESPSQARPWSISPSEGTRTTAITIFGTQS